MDGPSTNWKFYDDLVRQRDAEDVPMLLNMGSCSLHVIHGAFKHGVYKVHRGILMACYAVYTTSFMMHQQDLQIIPKSLEAINYQNASALQDG